MVSSIVGVFMFGQPKAETPKVETVAAVAECQDIALGLPVGKLCAEQVGSNVLIKLDGATIISLPLSGVNLPPVTVEVPETVRVTLPRVTVTRPPVTVTLPRVTVVRPPVTVSLPGVTLPGQTTTVRLPGATETVTLPGQTLTLPAGVQTVIQPQPGSSQSLPVAIVTSRGPNGQTIQTSVTITPSPQPGPVTTKPGPERRVSVSVPTFVGLSIGLLLLGLILGLLAIYLAYAAGYKDSEAAEKVTWNKFRNDLFGKKE